MWYVVGSTVKVGYIAVSNSILVDVDMKKCMYVTYKES